MRGAAGANQRPSDAGIHRQFTLYCRPLPGAVRAHAARHSSRVPSRALSIQANPEFVTFINPVSVKGVDLALEIAAGAPDIPFCFVKAWPIPLREQARLRRGLKRAPNIVMHERTYDMREVYRKTRVLLVPSQWEAETWGRVVSEAQFSGIPV